MKRILNNNFIVRKRDIGKDKIWIFNNHWFDSGFYGEFYFSSEFYNFWSLLVNGIE